MHDGLHAVQARYQTDVQRDHEGIAAKDVLYFLIRWRHTIAMSIAVSIMLAIVYLLHATPLFTAQAQILVQPRFAQIFREQGSEDASALDTPEVESKMVMLRSERVADRVVKQLGLLKDPIFLQPRGWSPLDFIGRIRSAIDLYLAPGIRTPASIEEEHRQAAMKQIWDNMDAKRVGLSHVIEISFSSPDPRQAAKITNAIAEAYIADQLDMRSESAREGSIWLETRIDRLRDQMNRAALRVKEFRARRDYRIPQLTDQKPVQATTATTTLATDKTWLGITLEELESQAQTYRKIYESYLQALGDSVQRQSYPETNTHIITHAKIPDHRSHPRGILTLALAAIAGGLLGLGISLVRHSLTA